MFKFKNNLVKKSTDEDSMIFGLGYRVDDKAKSQLYEIRQAYSKRAQHFMCFGTTGVGKTRLIENLIEQSINKNHNVVIIDPKGDYDLLSKVTYLAKKNNRLKELLFLSPQFPELSITLNPFKNYSIEDELIGHIMSIVPSDDEFFYNVAFEVTTIVIKLLLMVRRANDYINKKVEKAKINKEAEGNNSEKLLLLYNDFTELNKKTIKDPITFLEISHYISHRALSELFNRYLKEGSAYYNAFLEMQEKEVVTLTSLFKKVIESPVDYFSKISSTLRGTLTKMTTGNVASVIATDVDNVFIDRLENNEGVILFVHTGAMLNTDVASSLSKLTLSMIQTLVGRLNGSGKKFLNTLDIYVDELNSALYNGVETIYAQARSANLTMNGFTQSAADLIAAIGEDRTRRILDLTSTKVFMRLNDVSSAKNVVELAGVARNFTAQFNIAGGISTREVEEDLLRVEDIVNLQNREFFYFGFEGCFKGKTLKTSKSKIQIKAPSTKFLRK